MAGFVTFDFHGNIQINSNTTQVEKQKLKEKTGKQRKAELIAAYTGNIKIRQKQFMKALETIQLSTEYMELARKKSGLTFII